MLSAVLTPRDQNKTDSLSSVEFDDHAPCHADARHKDAKTFLSVDYGWSLCAVISSRTLGDVAANETGNFCRGRLIFRRYEALWGKSEFDLDRISKIMNKVELELELRWRDSC